MAPHLKRSAAATAPGRNPLALSARTDYWTVLRGLLPFVWPAGRPDLRMQVVAAFCVLLLAKIVTVAVPVFFKEATDLLASDATGVERTGPGSSRSAPPRSSSPTVSAASWRWC